MEKSKKRVWSPNATTLPVDQFGDRNQLSEGVGEQVGADWRALPPGIEDRRAEIWEPLIAIADAAGGRWPEDARRACTELCKVSERKVSLGVRLLNDLHTIFGGAIALHTKIILERLHGDEKLDDDAPWQELGGTGLNDRGLARLLKGYGVKSTKVNVGGVSYQGYRREALHDPWLRYLPSYSAEAEPMEPGEPNAECSGHST